AAWSAAISAATVAVAWLRAVGCHRRRNKRLVALHFLDGVRFASAGAFELRPCLRDAGLLLEQLRGTAFDVRLARGDGRLRLLQDRFVLPAVESDEGLSDSHRLVIGYVDLRHITRDLRCDGHAVRLQIGVVRALDKTADRPPAHAPDDGNDQQQGANGQHYRPPAYLCRGLRLDCRQGIHELLKYSIW